MEIAKEDMHICQLRSYYIENSNMGIRRGISKGSQCWCACSNYMEDDECGCECGMLFSLVIERTEKRANTRILARMLDHLTITECAMLPDFTKGKLARNTMLEDVFKDMDISEFNYLDRIIYY